MQQLLTEHEHEPHAVHGELYGVRSNIHVNMNM